MFKQLTQPSPEPSTLQIQAQPYCQNPPQKQQSDQSGPHQNDYGSPEYWQQRYAKSQGQRFDWLENANSMRNLVLELLGADKAARILNVGCGNGEIQDWMYGEGYQWIWNNDISKQVIKQMNVIKQQKKQVNMVYQVMDVTQMTYPDNYFDFVLDKSTIDALLCSQNPFIQTAKMLQHIYRVLKPQGIYLAISYSDPGNRMKHFVRQHVKFQIQTKQLIRLNQRGDKLLHYAYICRKQPQQMKSKEWRVEFYKRLLKEEIQYYGDEEQEHQG